MLPPAHNPPWPLQAPSAAELEPVWASLALPETTEPDVRAALLDAAEQPGADAAGFTVEVAAAFAALPPPSEQQVG